MEMQPNIPQQSKQPKKLTGRDLLDKHDALVAQVKRGEALVDDLQKFIGEMNDEDFESMVSVVLEGTARKRDMRALVMALDESPTPVGRR